MESGEGVLVLLCELLLFLVLHILWDDDGFHYTKPPSSSNLWSSILWTIQSLFWFLYPKTSKYQKYFFFFFILIITLVIFADKILLQKFGISENS